MKTRGKLLLLTVFFALVIPLIIMTGGAGAQNYKGDGAVYSGGLWSQPTATTGIPCLDCHGSGSNHYTGAPPFQNAPDESSYLMTGHKNMLRKVAPDFPWAGADRTIYQTTDDLYGSGSIYDWISGTVNVAGTGTIRPLFYIWGAWIDRAQLNTAFDGGFTGEQYPNGNYDCGRCHTTGYRFDAAGPEPTTYLGVAITDAQFSRIPTDYDTGTSSWYLTSIQCERCHRDIANEAGGHNCYIGGVYNASYATYADCTGAGGTWTVVKPTLENATALCMECHRQESADTISQNITLSTDLEVSDGGSCSDGVSPDYATCVAIPDNTWDYLPFFDASMGQAFLNSPHARFSGTLAQTAQNSQDLSVSMTGAYQSAFKDASTGKNKGCDGCHALHQSTVEAVGAPKPFVNGCNDCHATTAQNILWLMKHPKGLGTPFPTGTAADIPGACNTCHMFSSYHFMRISTDPNYSTFPTVSQYYAGQTTANTASDGVLAGAVWADVNLACGQCHVGDGSSGTTTPQGSAPVYDKITLVGYAACIHNDSTVPSVTAAADGNGSISPSGVITVNSGDAQPFTITPDPGYQITTVFVDGVSRGAVNSYTISNITGCHTIIAYFKTQTYTITATAGAGGSISPPGVNSVNYGGNMTFTITPSAGYTTADVKVDGVSQGSVGTVPFMNVTANHTISATFTPNTAYTITASAIGNGTISPSGNVSVLGGANQTFTMTPAAGYRVDSFTVDGAVIGQNLPNATYSFANVTSPHTISVVFVPDTYAVTAAIYNIDNTAGNGTISPAGTTTVKDGDSLSYTITANPGYVVYALQVDSGYVQKGSLTSYTFSNISNNHTISAYVKTATFSVTASAGSGGTITNNGTYTYAYGATQTYTMTANAGYHVSDVTVDGNDMGAVTSYTFTNITMNHKISATFAPNPTFVITATENGNGTLTPSGSVNVSQGANQTFIMTPTSGFRVDSFSVDGTVIATNLPRASYTFGNVQGPHTISVNFVLNVYTITATATGNGTISPAGDTTVNPNSSVTYTITPAPGHSITTVVIDGTMYVGPKTSYTFNSVRANHTITAYFN